jgi:hypothetical protein
VCFSTQLASLVRDPAAIFDLRQNANESCATMTAIAKAFQKPRSLLAAYIQRAHAELAALRLKNGGDLLKEMNFSAGSDDGVRR